MECLPYGIRARTPLRAKISKHNSHTKTNDIAPTMAAADAPLRSTFHGDTAMVLHPMRGNCPYFWMIQWIIFCDGWFSVDGPPTQNPQTNDIGDTVAAADAPYDRPPMDIPQPYYTNRERIAPTSQIYHWIVPFWLVLFRLPSFAAAQIQQYCADHGRRRHPYGALSIDQRPR